MINFTIFILSIVGMIMILGNYTAFVWFDYSFESAVMGAIVGLGILVLSRGTLD